MSLFLYFIKAQIVSPHMRFYQCVSSPLLNLSLTKKVKSKQLKAYIIEADKRFKRVYFLHDAGRDINSTANLKTL